VKIGISVSKKIDVKRRKGVDRSGIGTGIIGIARSLFTAGNKISSYRLFRIALSAMVIVGTIGQIRGSRIMIDVSMSRSGVGRQFMIGWGAGLTYTTGMVGVSVIFQRIRRNLKKWQMHGFPMNLYSTGILIIHRVESKEVRY